MRDPVPSPASPLAITGRPSSFRARATLTPLPPATVRDSTARWRWPRRKFGTATVRSIAALRVTVRITAAALFSGLTLASSAAGQREPNAYHDRHRCARGCPDDGPGAGNGIVHPGEQRRAR